MESIADITIFIILAAICCLGILLTILQLPGTWLIVCSAVAYSWHYDWQAIQPAWLIAASVIAAAAEIVELASGAIAAKKSGASRRAAWYALFGGIAGALLLSIPVPLFGTLVGALIGCFGGALIAELQEGRGLNAGTKAGLFTAAGRAIGGVFKMFAALAVSTIILIPAAASLWQAATQSP